MRSNYRTASLGASVGSPPGRAVYGHILANAEPFSASVSRSIDKSVRLRKFPLRWLTFCLLEARPFPPLPPAHLHVSFVQGLICGLAIDHIPGPQLARSGPLCLVTFCLSEARPFPPLRLPPYTPVYLLCTGVGMWHCHWPHTWALACQARATVPNTLPYKCHLTMK